MSRAGGGGLVLAGTSHHVAPVAVRERLLGKSGERAVESLGELIRARCGPVVVVSTCNRLEVYCWTPRRLTAVQRDLVRLLAAWSGLSDGELRPHVYVKSGYEAAHHLIRVSAGLDSLAIGESQILGQVREAWQGARDQGSLAPELDGLFRRAVEAARRIRNQGGFDRHPSVAGIAVEAAAAVYMGFGGRVVAVLGAGATGQEAAARLLAAGAAHVTILNRSRRRAAEAKASLPPERVSTATLEALTRTLAEADILICATSAPAAVITREMVATAIGERHGRMLVVVDIAVPRDVDPEVRSLKGVHLIDLDDLSAGCALDIQARQRTLEQAEAQAAASASAYVEALRLREAVPDIRALRQEAEAIRRAELRRVSGRLYRLTPKEQATIEQMTHTIVQKLLHAPTLALKEASSSGGSTARRRRAQIMAAFSAHRRSKRMLDSAAQEPDAGRQGRN
jgi:glutamyl-tRNA reductase